MRPQLLGDSLMYDGENMRVAAIAIFVAGCTSLAGLDGDYVVGDGDAGASAAAGGTVSGGGSATGGSAMGGSATGGSATGGSATGGSTSSNTAGAGGFGGASSSGGAGGNGSGGGVTFCGDPGLVACYAFEGDALDGSQAGNDASASGVGYVSGQAGQAVEHGSGDTITIPSATSLGLSAYSQELWVFPTQLPTSGRVGIIDAPGRWSAWLYDTGVRCRGVAGPVIPVNTWTHLACVHDGTTLRLYVDGTEVASGANSLDPTPPTGNTHVGSNAPAGDEEWNGRMDQLRIFNYARTPQQICAAAGMVGC
jgi:hypothetical protein